MEVIALSQTFAANLERMLSYSSKDVSRHSVSRYCLISNFDSAGDHYSSSAWEADGHWSGWQLERETVA